MLAQRDKVVPQNRHASCAVSCLMAQEPSLFRSLQWKMRKKIGKFLANRGLYPSEDAGCKV